MREGRLVGNDAGKIMEDEKAHDTGLMGHCEDLGFYSQRDGEPLEVLNFERHDLTYMFKGSTVIRTD